MRVLQFNPAYAPDLADPEALLERYEILTGWSEAVLAAGAQAVGVVQRFHREAHLQRNGVEHIFCADSHGPLPSRYASLRNAYQRAAAWRPDIVHVNGLNTAWQCAGLRRALPAGVALVVQDHAGTLPSWGRRPRAFLRQLIDRRGLSVVDACLFTAREIARPWIDAGLIRHGQEVVEVPAASTRMRRVPHADARRVTGMHGSPALLWVGRLAKVKDPMTVLSAIAMVVDRCPDLGLTMVHSGGELVHDVHDRIADDARLRTRVRVLTGVERCDLPALFSAADVFVLGSLHEACGVALIEAMACGASPVVPAIPAFEALTGGGAVGGLWKAGDAAAMADALVTVCAGDLPRARTRAIVHFHRYLSWKVTGRTALRAYERAVAVRRNRVARR